MYLKHVKNDEVMDLGPIKIDLLIQYVGESSADGRVVSIPHSNVFFRLADML